MYDSLFSGYARNSMLCENRFSAQAMEINAALPGGGISSSIIKRYCDLARGRWGLVFSEAVAVNRHALARESGLVLDDDTADGFNKLVRAFRQAGGSAPFIIQLTHAGRNNCNPEKKICVYEDSSGITCADEEELERTREMFIHAARLAREAGADGVDIKACHGYLGGELLRPANTRDDRYGKTPGNRAFFISSIIMDLKRSFPDFIAGSRISMFEGIRGGCGTSGPGEVIENLGDILEVLGHIVNAGADFINVSAGIPVMTPELTRPDRRSMALLYSHFRYAMTVKQAFPGIAVIGSAYSAAREEAPELADRNIARGFTDFAGFGRQSLADPLMPSKIMKDTGTADWCTLCGRCSALLKKQERVICTVYDREEKDKYGG